ncbi:MAG TPA: metallophosphoesterase, partial [bacterium]|nr:metallophosphoesterase [bacterium]
MGWSTLALVALGAGCGDNTPISFNHHEPGSSDASSASWCGSGGGQVTDAGGTLDCLSFAIVGDTRPPTIDDTANYPTAIIDRIYQDLQSESPRPAFAITTGDYQFSRTTGSEAGKQIDLYLQAQAAFANPVFHAMGNHECTGATDSNCTGTAATSNHNYAAFLSKMIQPHGLTHPYYSWKISATDGSWTAKFVVVAANAWDSAQATWLDQTLSENTTYTFVIRHEADYAGTAPGVKPSGQILAQHKYTLLLVGHTHTFDWIPAKREMVVGLGGAPLTGSIDYGYVVGRSRSDGAIQFAVYDYKTHATLASFAVD